jgi:hypothetical protein
LPKQGIALDTHNQHQFVLSRRAAKNRAKRKKERTVLLEGTFNSLLKLHLFQNRDNWSLYITPKNDNVAKCICQKINKEFGKR